jgi:hypothetical protein
MMRKELAALDSDEVKELSMTISLPASLHDHLETLPVVRNIKEKINEGSLVFEQIQSTVSEWMGDFRPGTRFAHEPALSALAVALERRPGPDTEQFLEQLASLRIMEIPIAPRIASECLRNRKSLFSSMTSASRRFSSKVVKIPCREVTLPRISTTTENQTMRVA